MEPLAEIKKQVCEIYLLMRYEGRMKNLGRVTHLPSNPIPKRKFIPVTNPRKVQFQPQEIAKNHQKQVVCTGVGGG